MLVVEPIGGLGGFREDVVGALGPFLGTTRVNSFINSLQAEIRREAEAGARQAIPDITLEVEQTARAAIRPVAIGAVALGVVGLAVGGFALWRSFR